MIGISETQWLGLEGLGDEALQEIRPQAEAAVLGAVLLLESTIKKKLTGRRSGRAYVISKTGKLHIASAPGEPPAVLFGALRNSVGHSKPEWDGFTVSATVGPGLGQSQTGGGPDPAKAYARRMEYGGAGGGVMILPRPYIEPSVQEARTGMEEIMKQKVGG